MEKQIELGRGFVLVIFETSNGGTWAHIVHKKRKKAVDGPHPTSAEYKKAKFILASLAQ